MTTKGEIVERQIVELEERLRHVQVGTAERAALENRLAIAKRTKDMFKRARDFRISLGAIP